MKKALLTLSFLASIAVPTGTLLAQESAYPSKPINYIIPFPPGGPTDVAGRVMGEALGKVLGQSVVVENKSGASGSIGMTQLIRSPADGYTIAALGAPSLTAPFILESAPYNLSTDIKPIGIAYITPLVIVTNPKKTPEIKDMASLVTFTQKHAQGINYTSSSIGSTGHLSMELLRKDLGLTMTHIPYRGSAPALSALMAGDVTLMYSDLVAVLQHIKAGALTPLAVNTDARLDELPDTPTLKELNMQGSKAVSWGGIVAPKNTPDAVVQKLEQSLAQILKDPEVLKKMKSVGAYPFYQNAKAAEKIIADDSQTWAKVIKDNQIKPQN